VYVRLRVCLVTCATGVAEERDKRQLLHMYGGGGVAARNRGKANKGFIVVLRDYVEPLE
jgi:hypothetical protein